jgi:hypothetical protein
LSQLRKRATVLIGLIGLCLLAGDGWAVWQWTSSQQQLGADQQQFAADNQLGRSIEALRRSPEKLEATARSADSLAKLIEAAAQQVGVGADRIVHVAPSEPRRIGNTPYLEQTTAVELREVGVKQLVDLTQALGRVAPRLTIPSVSIRTPHSESNAVFRGELWNVELTLTGHLYEPKIPASP